MDGQFLLKTARSAVENFVKTKKAIKPPEHYPEEFAEKRGVFVTIYSHVHLNGFKEPSRILRGCIGLPYAEKPLIDGVIEAAVSACGDPRFLPLKQQELNDISIEVSVLGDPEEIKIRNRRELPEILDSNFGYIIKKGVFSGLFLPQVWKELPDRQEFLEQLCLKAGLLADSWLDPACRIYKFGAEVFEEK